MRRSEICSDFPLSSLGRVDVLGGGLLTRAKGESTEAGGCPGPHVRVPWQCFLPAAEMHSWPEEWVKGVWAFCVGGEWVVAGL